MLYTVKMSLLNNFSAKYLLHDVNKNGDYVLINPVLALALNQAGSFTFTIAQKNPNYDRINKPMYTIIDIYDEDEQPYWRGRVTTINVDTYGQKSVTCEGALSLLADTIQAPGIFTGEQNSRAVMSVLVAMHNNNCKYDACKLTLGNCWNHNSVKGETDYNTTLDAISEIFLKKYGGYVAVQPTETGLILNYTKNTGRINDGQLIEFGDNLISLSRSWDCKDVYTCLIPLGAEVEIEGQDNVDEADRIKEKLTIASVNEGQIWIHRDNDGESLVSQYGKIFRVMENSDITDAQKLLSWGKTQLDSVDFDKVEISVNAIDKSTIGNYTSLKIGDRIYIKSTVHDINMQLPISAMTIYLSDPTKSQYTLGISSDRDLTSLVR